MLVLTRKLGESIAINDDIKIVVIQIKGRQVRLGIEAPHNTKIHREEVYLAIQEQNNTMLASAHQRVLECFTWETTSALLRNLTQDASSETRHERRKGEQEP